MEFMYFLESLSYNDSFKILCIVIALDTVFGILRSIKEKKVNSTIGIDGIIRKVGMLFSVIFLLAIDNIIQFNLIGFIPETIRTTLKWERVGFNELFNLLFIMFEILSVFKNMIFCRLPIPYKLQKYLEKALKEFTGELSTQKINYEKVVNDIAESTVEKIYNDTDSIKKEGEKE